MGRPNRYTDNYLEGLIERGMTDDEIIDKLNFKVELTRHNYRQRLKDIRAARTKLKPKKTMSTEHDNNYAELFGAVYKRAVRDDIKSARARIRNALVDKGVPRRSAIDYITKNKKAIADAVRHNVYRESKSWGDGRVTKNIQGRAMNELIERMVEAYE